MMCVSTQIAYHSTFYEVINAKEVEKETRCIRIAEIVGFKQYKPDYWL